MKSFSEFGIAVPTLGFTGDKIKVKKILNRQITVHAYKIEPSKFEGKGDCLYVQIEVDGNMHLLFTGSVVLAEQIKKVPHNGFPFQTTIVENNERLQFT